MENLINEELKRIRLLSGYNPGLTKKENENNIIEQSNPWSFYRKPAETTMSRDKIQRHSDQISRLLGMPDGNIKRIENIINDLASKKIEGTDESAIELLKNTYKNKTGKNLSDVMRSYTPNKYEGSINTKKSLDNLANILDGNSASSGSESGRPLDNTGSSPRYTPCPGPEFKKGCYNADPNLIKKVQGCLGLVQDGKFWNLTQSALEKAGYPNGFTTNDIDKICGGSKNGVESATQPDRQTMAPIAASVSGGTPQVTLGGNKPETGLATETPDGTYKRLVGNGSLDVSNANRIVYKGATPRDGDINNLDKHLATHGYRRIRDSYRKPNEPKYIWKKTQ